MRDIKFRGKSIKDIGNIKKDDWIYGGISINNDRVWIDMDYIGQVVVDIKTIGQYTGLHDKNGKEIYEGDIVYVESEDENAVIIWDDEDAKFIIKFDDWTSDFDCFFGKELEVIGNIYDNTNLLEKEGI